MSAYIHIVLGRETLDVKVGRSLVFKRLVDHSVILLSISSTLGNQCRTYLGEFAGPSGPLPLEVGIILVGIVHILEPSHKLVSFQEDGSLHHISPASS